MNSDEIRKSFLDFFQERGHLVVPSSSLIPHDDPTILFTTAGMVQFKPYFMGLVPPPSPRLASCQKCFRTTDIDSIGDPKHLTFFEMLGNFSIGDYFKKEAIAWAWEYIAGVLKLPPERLWITIFRDDEEAMQHWLALGIPKNKIVKGDEKDNFWGPAGDTGPCGPCSEIHYDFGEKHGCGRPSCSPLCSCNRFLEIWNLVFTQVEHCGDGQRIPLPNPNIDTGMGLERVTAVLQGGTTVYETDLFLPLISLASNIAGISYKKEEESGRRIRVIVEHSRGIAFLISDGVLPGNEGRGYVLRRIIRRTILFGHMLGIERPFLSELSEGVVRTLGHVYPELKEQKDFTLRVVRGEEKRFQQTLDNGLILLEKALEESKERGQKCLSGKQVFQLYDTYGFPWELTREILSERGFSFDLADFNKEMEAQRERSRATQKFSAQVLEKEGLEFLATSFLGYETLKSSSLILKLFKDGKAVTKAEEGDSLEIILRETPFYSEMGGQVGDEGIIQGPQGKAEVKDTLRLAGELIVHKAIVEQGSLQEGDRVEAEVDEGRRLDIARNHTATHLLQAALRALLGKHIQQKGSYVGPDRLRFDFTHVAALTAEEKRKIEQDVNRLIRKNIPVQSQLMKYSEAISRGALAFFGEKYGEEVRMVIIGEPPVSLELCGGTHLEHTGQIGFFAITSESSIGAGLRRIEGVTGRGAEMLFQSYMDTILKVSGKMSCPPEKIEETVDSKLKELDEIRKLSAKQEKELIKVYVEDIKDMSEEVSGIKVIAASTTKANSMQSLREIGDLLKSYEPSSIIVLGTIIEGKPAFLSMVPPDLVARGFHAGHIVKQVASITGGGGGGRPEMAQAGGKDPSKMDEALKKVKEILQKEIPNTNFKYPNKLQ